jgi:hypothetical protein
MKSEMHPLLLAFFICFVTLFLFFCWLSGFDPPQTLPVTHSTMLANPLANPLGPLVNPLGANPE